ncbi:MAG: ThiF family adenylyltransferase [Kiritimatiellia bacterium]
MPLSNEQKQRYARQIALPNFGEAEQERLLRGRVLVIGAGGLGSPALLYLAAAGVGHLGIADNDAVDLTNLQRQILHSTDDLGRMKVHSGRDTLSALNPDVHIITHELRFTADNALDVLKNYDFIIDATDNLPSKFLIADACHLAGKPYSHAGILEFYGQTITVRPGKTACYRCIFRNEPAECPPFSKAVMGVVPGILGTIQATEAIKYLLGIGRLLTNRLLTYDALDMAFRTIDIPRNENCPLCGKNPEIKDLNSHPTQGIP